VSLSRYDFSQQDCCEVVKLGSRILRGWVADFSGGMGRGFCLVVRRGNGFKITKLLLVVFWGGVALADGRRGSREGDLGDGQLGGSISVRV